MSKVLALLAFSLLAVGLVGLGASKDPLLGFTAQVILSGSMEPSIPTGSLIVSKYVQPEEIQVDDVLTFYENASGSLVSHRVLSREMLFKDVPRFTTKGDANEVADSWVILPAQVRGKVVYTIPYLGYLVHILKTPPGFILAALCTFWFLVFPEITGTTRTLADRRLIS